MDPQRYALLALACFAAMASPGPGVFAVVTRSLALGTRRCLGFIAGMVLGDLCLLALAMFGVAALIGRFEHGFAALRLLAAAYMVYLAWRCWTAPAVVQEAPGSRAAGEVVSGLVLTLSNPKTILFYVALLPTVLHAGSGGLRDFAAIAGVVAAVLAVVMLLYSVLASLARRYFKQQRSLRFLNRLAALGMLLVAVALIVMP